MSDDFDWTKNVNHSNPLEALRLIRGSSMAILGTTLYIDGGEYYTSGFNGTTESDGPPDFDSNWAASDYLYTLDLKKPYISRNFTEMSSGMKAIKKSNTPGWSSTIGGSIRTVGDKFYHAGGIQTHYKLPGNAATAWSYDGMKFAPETLTGDVEALETHNGASAASPDGTIYYFAGQASNGTAVADLVAWDTTKGEVEVLSTENPFVANTGLVGTTLHWIPVGLKGSVVSFGGSLMSGADSSQGNPMTKAAVFDIANKKWYTQPLVTQADDEEFPRTRKFFAAVTPSPNKSQKNWDILVYGGLTGEATPGSPGGDRYDDVWALTLPSFQWLKYYTQPGGGNWGKYNRSCTMLHDRYLTFLNQVPTNADTTKKNDDLFAFYDIVNAKGFNAGGFVEYDPTLKGYSSPLKVQVAIANPVKNNLVPGLERLFITSYFDPNNTSALTSAGQPSMLAKTSTSHTGAIAGGVVGGIAVIAVIAGLLFFFLRRNKRKGNRHFENVPGQGGTSDESKVELPAIPPPPTYPHDSGAYQVVPQTTHEVYGDEAGQWKPPHTPAPPAAELSTDFGHGPVELPASPKTQR